MKNLKCKVLALTMGVSVFISGKAFAQVPSYVPTNGLVGWWPFNGNANDESGNGNDGTVNGATLTADRFGVANKAYSFNGVSYIDIGDSINLNNLTLSVWINSNDISSQRGVISQLRDWGNYQFKNFHFFLESNGYAGIHFGNGVNYNVTPSSAPGTILTNNWYHLVATRGADSAKLYLNGVLTSSVYSPNYVTYLNPKTYFGARVEAFQGSGGGTFFKGVLDDICIWNKVLSACEIQDLYNSQINSVDGSIAVSPNSAAIGSNVTLSTSSNSTNLQWQSNPSNYGWQNVPSNSSYIGGTTNTLTVNNVQLTNHNQPFRVIASLGNCTDTSNIATIQIADTCITNVTVYDTLLTTVTDTLIINTTLSLPAPNNENTIKIYPNPASDHITIDNGNFAAMTGYSIKIENNAGQQVFQSAINQQQFYVDLSSWTGNGLYFVHLIDSQNNTVTVRKIVLQ